LMSRDFNGGEYIIILINMSYLFNNLEL